MPVIAWFLTVDEAKTLGITDPTDQWTGRLAEAPYRSNDPRSPMVNWPLVERAAMELETASGAWATLLIAIRDGTVVKA